VKLASSLGEHVVSITPSRTTVESTDPNRKVALSAAFAGGYELDCFTVNGQRINGNTFEITDRSVTVNAVAKKKQSDMEKWKEEIDKMVDEANKKAKEKLDKLSADDRKKIEDLAQKVKGTTKNSFDESYYGKSASATVVSSKYSICTVGGTGVSTTVLGVGLVADGAFMLTTAVKTGAVGKQSTHSLFSNHVGVKSAVKSAVKRLVGAQNNVDVGAAVNDLMTNQNLIGMITQN